MKTLTPKAELPTVAPYREEGNDVDCMKPMDVRKKSPFKEGEVVWVERHDRKFNRPIARMARIELVRSHLLEGRDYWIPCYGVTMIKTDNTFGEPKKETGRRRRYLTVYPGEIHRGYELKGLTPDWKPDVPKAMEHAIRGLQMKYPCLQNREVARLISRLYTPVNEPTSQEELNGWAYNTLNIEVPQIYWGKDGKDNDGKLRMEYVRRLEKMTEAELVTETDSKLWLSAFANNNPRSDFHWHADIIYKEWYARGKGERYGERHKVLTDKVAGRA